VLLPLIASASVSLELVSSPCPCIPALLFQFHSVHHTASTCLCVSLLYSSLVTRMVVFALMQTYVLLFLGGCAAGFSELHHLESLQVLELADNGINMTLSQFETNILANLRPLGRLMYLSFAGNPIEKTSLHFVEFVVYHLPQLRFYNYEPVSHEQRTKGKQLAALNMFQDSVRCVCLCLCVSVCVCVCVCLCVCVCVCE
jgi:hypothetical protein